MDLQIANWMFKHFGTNKAIQTVASVLTNIGDALFVSVILIALLCFSKTRKIGAYATITVLISFLINQFILKEIIGRDRPFVSNPELLEVFKYSNLEIPKDSSMPSGHSLVSMSLAVSVFLFNKKFGIASICLSILCGLTRMILCVHYFTDVLVGFALGVIFAILIHYLIKLIIKKYLKRKENQYENNSACNQQ